MSRFSTLAIASALLGGSLVVPTAADAALLAINAPGYDAAVQDGINDFVGTSVGDFIVGTSWALSNVNKFLATTQANVTLNYSFVAAESGFNNRFRAGTPLATPPVDFTETFSFTGPVNTPLGGYTQATAGKIDFTFSDQTLAISNGQGPSGNADVFFAFLVSAGAGKYNIVNTATNLAVLAFNDSFGDDNGDDMLVFVNAVPLPGAALLFGSALVGLGWMRRRRGNETGLAVPA